ncbi:hypothetical protein YTPLAS18_11710 [Nitrospira sp.]|nr:hypothetical protein YTPLAS18_11710 [Nitrospira sp.]
MARLIVWPHRFSKRRLLLTLAFVALCTTDVLAQRAETPIVGHYPGGHVGLRGGATPPEGSTGAFNFFRYNHPGDLKNANGGTIQSVNKDVFVNITGAQWSTKYKFFGMNYGGLLAVPFNNIYNRASGQSTEASGFSLGDVVFSPLILFGKQENFDYQVGLAVWAPSGTFSPGASTNHGSGFWELLYSVGGVYYPDGKRNSFAISSVVRIEQNFKQRHTDIHVGDDVVMDWGISGPLLAFGETFKHVFDIGVSGFATTQFTRETGMNAALNTSFYRVFGVGPEMNYYIPAWNLKFLFRPQFEFGARNTTQGHTYWLAVSYKFGHL